MIQWLILVSLLQVFFYMMHPNSAISVLINISKAYKASIPFWIDMLMHYVAHFLFIEKHSSLSSQPGHIAVLQAAS